MEATFDIGTKELVLHGISDAKPINDIRKGMGWKLVSLRVKKCEPVKCAICGKVVAVEIPFEDEDWGTYRLMKDEYGYKTLDGEERAVCCNCWNHEERYYLTADEIAATME